MVLVIEPAITPVEVIVVTLPSTVVVIVVTPLGAASVAGTTE